MINSFNLLKEVFIKSIVEITSQDDWCNFTPESFSFKGIKLMVSDIYIMGSSTSGKMNIDVNKLPNMSVIIMLDNTKLC